MTTEYCLVMITTPSEGLASHIADALVDRYLAACVQTTHISSTYRWSSEVHHEGELLLLVKTRTELLDQIIEAVRDLHVYDAPEIIALPIIGGSADYLHWVGAETHRPHR